MTSYPIKIDRKLPYSANIANAINAFWKCQVAFPIETFGGGNAAMHSLYGVPDKLRFDPRRDHHAIVEIRKVGRKWRIISNQPKGGIHKPHDP